MLLRLLNKTLPVWSSVKSSSAIMLRFFFSSRLKLISIRPKLFRSCSKRKTTTLKFFSLLTLMSRKRKIVGCRKLLTKQFLRRNLAARIFILHSKMSISRFSFFFFFLQSSYFCFETL